MDVGPTNEPLVYYKERDLWIRFPSVSDALVARLMLEQGVNPTALDAFLRTLSNPKFSLASVTLNRAADVDRHFAECGRAKAWRRAEVTHGSFRTAGVPHIILELVTESIANSMFSVYRELSIDGNQRRGIGENMYWLSNAIVRAFLTRMALVHRTWTVSAQRALRDHIVVIGRKDLRNFVRGPFCGPWIHDFGYYEGDKLDKAGDGKDDDTDDDTDEDDDENEHENETEDRNSVVEMLTSVLLRAPNLLFFGCYFERASSGSLRSFRNLLQDIGHATNLLGLHLQNKDVGDCDLFEELCVAVSQLPRLRFLFVEAFDPPHQEISSSHFLAYVPSPSLRTLNVDISTLSVGETFTKCLLYPRDGFAPEHLVLHELQVHDGNWSDICEFLQPVVHDLQTLHMRFLAMRIGDDETDLDNVKFLRTLLSDCTSLKTLCLDQVFRRQDIFSNHVPHPEPFLPSTLEVLRLQMYCRNPPDLDRADASFQWVLASNVMPQLRLFLVQDASLYFRDLIKSGDAVTIDLSDQMPMTSETCAASKVDFRWVEECCTVSAWDGDITHGDDVERSLASEDVR